MYVKSNQACSARCVVILSQSGRQRHSGTVYYIPIDYDCILFEIRNLLVLACSACLRYAGCEHFVSNLRPRVGEKLSRILEI